MYALFSIVIFVKPGITKYISKWIYQVIFRRLRNDNFQNEVSYSWWFLEVIKCYI